MSVPWLISRSGVGKNPALFCFFKHRVQLRRLPTACVTCPQLSESRGVPRPTPVSYVRVCLRKSVRKAQRRQFRKGQAAGKTGPMAGAFVCWGSCNNRCTTHGKAYTTDIYFLIVLGAPSLRSTFRQGWFLLRAVREGSAPRLSLPLVGGHLLPVSSFCTRLHPDLLLS